MSWWFLWSLLISQIPDAIMYFVSGMSMIILVFFSSWNRIYPSVIDVSKPREYCWYISYFICSILGNLFPAGSGIWYYFVNTMIFRLSPLESKGIASFVSIFWFIGTLSWIFLSGFYNSSYALSLASGMIIGGYFGTKHIIKMGDEILRYILLTTIAIFALYFLYLAYTTWQII